MPKKSQQPPPPMRSISLLEFRDRFVDSVKKRKQRFTWFFGAGCSISSNINAAGKLVGQWVDELWKFQGLPGDMDDDWLNKTFESYDRANPALHYAKAFERRFPAPNDRQQEIERICAGADPGYGYAALAQLMSREDIGALCNTVLTTNFDDLVADALYIYGDKSSRPLVVTHEALARYIRIASSRPTIVKLHGDAHIDPKNLTPETKRIRKDVAKDLHPLLSNSSIIFVGYGGNDESIAHFFAEYPSEALATQIYWVGRHDPGPILLDWLCRRGALRVDHTDFDEMMHLLRGGLDIPNLERQRWDARWEQLFNGYYDSLKKFEEKVKQTPESSQKDALRQVSQEVLKNHQRNEWDYYAQTFSSTSPAEEAATYEEGLKAYPKSPLLNGMYALFLETVRKDIDAAETYYRRAIEVDPKHAGNLGNYALFLQGVRKEMDTAETFYKRALDVDPRHAGNLGNYAVFVQNVRNDLGTAEALYKRAIDADPKNASNLGNYALFLETVRKDMDTAEAYYKRAIDADPKHANNLANYAAFLQVVRRNMDAAETFYKRAIEVVPANANSLGGYASFLQTVRKDLDGAEALYKRALDIEPNNASLLAGYATLLQTVGKDMAAAEGYYKRSLDADPKNTNNLGGYALFLQNVRKDMDVAEDYFKRAIDADPEHANNLGSYAVFLQNVRKDMDAAEGYYKRAVDADPRNANNLGNYALFLQTVRKQMDAAETYFKHAIDADPEHANSLKGYAWFLESVRKDLVAAETFFKRAVEADPADVNNLSNYAQLLLSSGRTAEGLALVDTALAAAELGTKAEAGFYRFAHDRGRRKEALGALKEAILSGARSPDWDFSPNIERAEKDGFAGLDLLKDIAKVISANAPVSILDKHKEWQDA